MILSKGESEAFAAIVARLGDPEQRRLRRIVLAASAVMICVAVVLIRLLLGWAWGPVVAFTTATIVGLVGGLFLMARSLFRRNL